MLKSKQIAKNIVDGSIQNKSDYLQTTFSIQYNFTNISSLQKSLHNAI